MAGQQALQLAWEFDGKFFTREVEIGQSIIIGRLPECDIVISQEQISRRHAQITGRLQAGQGVFELRNLSQTNNIFFSQPDYYPPLAFDQVVTIPDGCQFLVGTVPIAARLPQVQPAQPEQPPARLKMVRCANCRELVDATLKDCPWCGSTLAFGGTMM